jgi:biopolymer transport protein TolR
MSMSSGTSAEPNINVTPFIDILLVLLIIFMVITPLKPARFKTTVPQKSDEINVNTKVSPRTLSINIKREDLSVTLIRGIEPVAVGSVNDMGGIATWLSDEFTRRVKDGVYKQGYETRGDLPPDERIEKTVFVKAPQSIKYGEVVKVIDAIKGAGANPVGLQTEMLEQ